MRLSNYGHYTDYFDVSTSGPLVDSYISACEVKSTTIDRIEYVNQCQPMDYCGFA